MVIAAHPDDIESFVGGTVAAFTQQGVEVTYVLATHGEGGSDDPSVPVADVARTRAAEQQRAADALGVDRVVWLGGGEPNVYPDGELTDTLELRLELVKLIRSFEPNIVITFDPTCISSGTYVNHADHRAVGAAAVAAVWPAAANVRYHRELLDDDLQPHVVGELWLTVATAGRHVVDIAAMLDLKAKALSAHKSQLPDSDAVRRRVLDDAANASGPGAPQFVERFIRIRINAEERDPLGVEVVDAWTAPEQHNPTSAAT